MEWRPAGWSVCLPLLISLAPSSPEVLFWHRLTRVVPEKGRKTVVVWWSCFAITFISQGPKGAKMGADFLVSQVLKSPEEVLNFYPEIWVGSLILSSSEVSRWRKDEVSAWSFMVVGVHGLSSLQSFDTVGWLTRRSSGQWKHSLITPNSSFWNKSLANPVYLENGR